MLCQKCGKFPATVHREATIYRQKVEEHLCSLCAGLESEGESIESAPRSQFTQSDIWRRDRATIVVAAACRLLEGPLDLRQRHAVSQILFDGLRLLMQAQANCPKTAGAVPLSQEATPVNDQRIDQFNEKAMKIAEQIRAKPVDHLAIISKLWENS